MGYIFYIMGKSSSGKDTIYKRLMEENRKELSTVVTYTTRPPRSGESDGREYFFVSKERYMEMKSKGLVIESRDYHTVQGIWSYFTAEDGQIDIKRKNYLLIGTLESYEKLRNYYGKERVVPIYIEVEDGERLERAISREKKQETPCYEEMCRRFLADQRDFCEERLHSCDIVKRYINSSLEECVLEIWKSIESHMDKDVQNI